MTPVVVSPAVIPPPRAATILTPEAFGAIGDGIADDWVALQAWADALRDGGIGAVSSIKGYATSNTLTFMPSTNSGPVAGPRILGNLQLKGHANIVEYADLLHIFNPDVVTTSQNFYSPIFDGIELWNTKDGNGLALRGFWGSIKRIFGSGVKDVVQFPNFEFNGIPDEYESICDLGDITGIDYTGTVYRNLIGIGASPTIHNIRGTGASFSQRGVIVASGGERITGCIAYTGHDWAVVIDKAGVGAVPHEIYMQGCGDIDVAEYGFYIANLEHAHISGHRMNVEPPSCFGMSIPSWPIIGYMFGDMYGDGNGHIKNVRVDAYVTIRPGVTAENIGTIFSFSNSPNIINLELNVTMSDQTGVWAAMPFATRYRHIHPLARIKITENGLAQN